MIKLKKINRKRFESLSLTEKSKIKDEVIRLYIEEMTPIQNIPNILNLSRSVVYYIIESNNLTKSKETRYSEITSKRETTMHKRYGDTNPMRVPEFKSKAINTSIKRYGETHPSKCKQIMDKVRTTNIERYGCECSLQNKKVKEKSRNTCINRYGVDNPMKSDKVKQKSINTCRKHYGVDYHVITNENKESIRKSLELKGVTSPVQLSKNINLIKILNNEELFKQFILSIPYDNRYKSNICELLEIGISQLNWRIRKWGLSSIIKFKHNCSHYELEILNFLSSLNIKFIRNCRTKIKNFNGVPLELDFYIPDYEIAIEFNGIYWHDKSNPVREQLKTDLCADIGITLIHIWEDDWNINKDHELSRITEEIDKYSIVDSVEIEEVENLPVYDIEVPEYNNFTLANGLVVHNSRDTLQQFTQSGFNTRLLSLDRTPDGYLYTKASLNERRISMLEIPELETELINLERNNMTGKVDHPVNGSKDIADSLAGALTNASENTDIDEMYGAENFDSMFDINDDVYVSQNKYMKNYLDNIAKNNDNLVIDEELKADFTQEFDNQVDRLVSKSEKLDKEMENKIQKERMDKIKENESKRMSNNSFEKSFFNDDNDGFIIW